MTPRQFHLPDVGEGLTEAEIVRWLVAVGDRVAVNEPIVEVETSKSMVELPSPFDGEVAEILVPAGRTVPTGTPLIRFRREEGAQRESVLVGYGPAQETGPRRRVRAKPPVRKLAKDLGIDLTQVRSTGPHGTVTREDVTGHRERTPTSPNEMRTAVTGVRRATAAAMSASAFTAPHVTEFLTVDVTRTVKLVERFQDDPAFRGTTVTVLTVVAAALLDAIRRHPEINASWDAEAGEIVRYHAVNLGIAVAAPRGLLVPNIKDAARLRLPELAAAIADVSARARAGQATPSDMAGGTITITNIGVFGVDTGTPILNPGEAAILCLGAIRRLPWEHRGRIALRSVTQLALSFDHRLVDGELASRVLARVAQVLHDPRWELLVG